MTGDHHETATLPLETLSTLVDTAFDIVLVVSDTGEIKSVLDSESSPLGYQPGQLQDRPVTEIITAKTVHGEPIETAFLSALDEDQSGTREPLLVFEAADGSAVVMTVTVVTRASEPGVVCGCRTVSHTQEQLLNTIADPLYVLDTENRFEKINDAMVAYTGYERDTLLGRHIDELVSVRSRDQLPAVKPDDERPLSATFETPLLTSDGDLLLTEAHVTALTDASGEYAGSVGVLRDISQRKSTEQEHEMLTQVLTRVFRHNIRNKLMVIRGHTDHLDRELTDDLGSHTDKITRTVNRLLAHSEKARLIEQVIETEHRYEMDLSRAVRQVVQSTREDHPSAEISLDIPEECSVEVHPEFPAAIDELIENAIRHAPDEKTPTVDIWFDRQDRTETLFVEDESGGLTEHEITVLREGSESALEHSSGVGLWLVRWVVEYSSAEMIAHRTEQGSLMGIRFGQHSTDDSPLVRAPAHVRELSAEQFRGETVVSRIDARHELEDIRDGLEPTGGHSVLITGEAGIGKTTLVEQFCEYLDSLEEPTTVATGSCESETERPYGAFRQALNGLPTDREFSDLLDDTAALSAETPDELTERKQALFADTAEELRAVAAQEPVVVIIEDIHWADQGTLDLFEYLLSEVGQWSHPVLFLGTYRTSDIDQTHPAVEIARETAAAGRGTLLELDPFGESQVETLLAEILDLEQLPQSFVSAVHDHTGGTPLFVNELGRHLAETLGPIRSPADLPKSLADVSVPDSVERAVSERLVDLPEEVRSVLCLGAVTGAEFSFDVLRTASEQSVDRLIDCIDTLVENELWVRSDTGIAFAHGVVREQTLAVIDDERRKSLHEAVARAIEQVHTDQLEDHAGRLAAHYEAIEDHETAVAYSLDAAEVAMDSYATETAIDAYERALDLGETHDVLTDSEIATVSAELADVYTTVGDLDAASETIEQGLTVAPAESTPRCRLLGERVTVLRIRGEYESAREHATKQRELARRLGEQFFEADATRSLGVLAWNRNELTQAENLFEQSLEQFEKLNDQQGKAFALNNLGTVAWRSGSDEQAVQYLQRALALFEEIGDRRWQAYILNNLGNVAMDYASLEQTEEYLERSLTIFEEIDNRHGKGYCLNSLGSLATERSDLGSAIEYFERCLAIFEEIGDRQNLADTCENLGAVYAVRGAFEQATDCFERGLDLCKQLGNERTQARILVEYARVERRQGRLDRASQRLDSADSHLTEIDARRAQARYEQERAALARQRGDYERARSHLDDAETLLTQRETPSIALKVRLERARVALADDSPQAARESVRQARACLDDRDSQLEEGRVQFVSGQIARQTGETTAARESLQEALDTFSETGAHPDLFETLQSLVELETEYGTVESAENWAREAMERLSAAPEPVVKLHEEWIDRQR